MFSRHLRGAAIAIVAVAGATLSAWRSSTPPVLTEMHVIKSPTCGCCAKWVDSMKKAGFSVTVENRAEFTDYKRAHGVTQPLESCHTAVVGGYTIEGHVPADLIRKLLAEKPAGVIGLTAPGMPASAPGMDMPGQRYTIYSFDSQGHTKVYATR